MNIELNSKGVNKKIKAHILSDKEMRAAGFTDHNKSVWYFMRVLSFPKQKRYKGFEITFNLSIPKDGSDISIDVLDEAFLQPYDYQYMLDKNKEFEPALLVQEQVEKWMQHLKEKGILEGHEVGDYI